MRLAGISGAYGERTVDRAAAGDDDLGVEFDELIDGAQFSTAEQAFAGAFSGELDLGSRRALT